MRAPWAEKGSRYTAVFEAKVMERLLDGMTVAAVKRAWGMSWTAVSGIMRRGVRRGLARRLSGWSRRLAVDEVAYSKGQSYVTVVSDGVTGKVLFVWPGRTRASLRAFHEALDGERLAAVETVSMGCGRRTSRRRRRGFRMRSRRYASTRSMCRIT